MTKTVLITGASGFIGSHLVEANLQKGNKVKAFVLPNDPSESKIKKSEVEIFYGDIRDTDSVEKAAIGADIIFHCAAVVSDWASDKLFEEVTVGGAENICKAALKAGVSRLVDISTNDVFGLDEDEVMNETCLLQEWNEPYPDHKIKAEKIMWEYHKENGLPVTMVYPCWVYGEGDQTFVPLLADAIVKGEMLFWRKDVLVWPTYIFNLVDLLLLISEDKRAIGNGYLVHDGESVTLQKFCSEIAKTLGVKPPSRRLPYSITYGTAVILEGIWNLLRINSRPLLTTYAVKNLGSKLKFSIAKAEIELGWKPPVSFEEGFSNTMIWLKTLDMESLKKK